MRGSWPARLLVDSQHLTVLRRTMAAAAPLEGCSLLLGRRIPSPDATMPVDLRLEAVWPCLNVWEPAAERERRFAIDPREQLLAQKWARPRGWLVLGTAHSHPGGMPLPSRTDRLLAFPPTLMVIVGAEGALRAWWLLEPGTPAAQADLRPLELLESDAAARRLGE
jgi:proteasome lid subunit RPN8/RPN11